MDHDPLDLARKRAHWRAWHRGTREADMLVGGFSDRHLATFDVDGLAWFEAVLAETDVDIMAWALGTQAPPARLDGEWMTRLRTLDYIAGVAPVAQSST